MDSAVVDLYELGCVIGADGGSRLVNDEVVEKALADAKEASNRAVRKFIVAVAFLSDYGSVWKSFFLWGGWCVADFC